MPTPGPTGPSCAGRWASPSTTTPSTTSSRSSTCRCSCGHVGRYGAGLNPLRGQNNVQGGGDMGAIPNRLPGFADILDPDVRARFDTAWDSSIPAAYGWHLTQMFEAMGRGDLRALYVLGENPAQSEADVSHAISPPPGPRPSRRPGHLPDQDGGAGRCRPARQRSVVRGRRHRHQLRAAGPAGPQGAGAAGRRPRRHRDHRWSSPRRFGQDWKYPGSGSTAVRPRPSGTSCGRSPRSTPA